MAVDLTFRADTSGIDALARNLQDEYVRYLHDGVSYGIYQELGTFKMAAQPFIRPAIEAHRGQFVKIIQAHGLEGLDRAVEDMAITCLATAKDLAPFDTGALRISLEVSKEEPR